jgi:hypothetical protein
MLMHIKTTGYIGTIGAKSGYGKNICDEDVEERGDVKEGAGL